MEMMKKHFSNCTRNGRKEKTRLLYKLHSHKFIIRSKYRFLNAKMGKNVCFSNFGFFFFDVLYIFPDFCLLPTESNILVGNYDSAPVHGACSARAQTKFPLNKQTKMKTCLYSYTRCELSYILNRCSSRIRSFRF